MSTLECTPVEENLPLWYYLNIVLFSLGRVRGIPNFYSIYSQGAGGRGKGEREDTLFKFHH